MTARKMFWWSLRKRSMKSSQAAVSPAQVAIPVAYSPEMAGPVTARTSASAASAPNTAAAGSRN